jgi:hypothetical protein
MAQIIAGARWFAGTLMRMAASRAAIDGIPVYLALPRTHHDLYLARLSDALRLLARFDPLRLARLKADLAGIGVWPLGTAAGAFFPETGLCVVDRSVFARGAGALAVATILVHEATHARVARAGVAYSKPHRSRIEALCKEAELAFLLRVPAFTNRDIILARAREAIGEAKARDPTVEASRVSIYAYLRDQGWPRWIAKVAAFGIRDRAR